MKVVLITSLLACVFIGVSTSPLSPVPQQQRVRGALSVTYRGTPPASVQKRIIYNSNLTPDGYYHNRYHALLSMAIYGDYNTTCPAETFTMGSELKNFPNATRPPWSVINTFGPTASGCQGFTAILPEMNKALIVFKGNMELEQKLPLDVISWEEAFNITPCHNCTVNAFAAQGYNECKMETNNWKDIREAYGGQGLVFSIAGHGLGGQHSLAASVDLHSQNIDYYSHNYGTPRTFNTAGANWYNGNFNGEAGERGIYGNDNYTEFVPVGPNYAHTGTPFYYSGLDPATLGPKLVICWDGNSQNGPIIDDPACLPVPQPNTTNVQDHYYYYGNVGTCGGDDLINTTVVDAFLASDAVKWNTSAVVDTSSSSSSGGSSGSKSSAGRVEVALVGMLSAVVTGAIAVLFV